MTPSFDSFALPPSLQTSLKKIGFEKPTPIQAKAIPAGLDGRDVLGLAQTGTGKTAAFSLPLIARLMKDTRSTALILAPTRELAQQIHTFIKQLLDKNTQLRSVLLVGGASMHLQLRELRMNPRIFVATPGRLVDHLRSRKDLLLRTSVLVLDEADRMLDMGFLPQIRVVLKHVPRERQTMMFSATLPREIQNLVREYLHNPVEIRIGEPSRPVARIQQAVVETTAKQKNDVLLDELNAREGSVLIFTRTKHRTDRLHRWLEDWGFKAARLHGNRTQAQRRQAIDGFRSGRVRILVATDIAARGLDIDDIGHVINYDLPQVAEDYIHRIGRTARNGREGKSLSLLTPEDRGQWKAISRLLK